MRVLDLFSGIGGFSLGLERTGGFKTVAFCEIEPFCRRVLARHWPEVPCFEDVTTAPFVEGMADVVVGGFPCQDVSCAGPRTGLSGARSGLYRELVRAIRVVRPRYAILENVADLLGRGLGAVLADLAEIGFDAEWDCVPARTLGAPHERDRIWIVAHAASEPLGAGGQPRIEGGLGQAATLPEGERRGQGRARRPADSFAWVRDEARRNAADAASARLERRTVPETARAAQPVSACGYRNPWRTWTDEPAISRVDDGAADWVDRTRATGNGLLPQIPELIGRAILAAEAARLEEAA